MKSHVSHDIKHRSVHNDEFYTPEQLAISLIKMCPVKPGESILDAAHGTGAFYKNFPVDTINHSTTEFEKWINPVDWIITNPPYSLLGKWWLPHTHEVAQKGYAYLVGQNNFTAKRVEAANKAGFGLTKIHICKVFKWYGLSYFCVYEKDVDNIISYDRIVWR